MVEWNGEWTGEWIGERMGEPIEEMEELHGGQDCQAILCGAEWISGGRGWILEWERLGQRDDHTSASNHTQSVALQEHYFP